jgi:hypothetical protein
MPNLVEHVENRIGKLPNVLLYLKDTAQVFMQIRICFGLYWEIYSEKKFVICYAGTINSNNPIDVLIEAGVLLKDEAIAF